MSKPFSINSIGLKIGDQYAERGTKSGSIFLAVLLGVCLRVPGLNESLWYDELWSTELFLTPLLRLARTIAADVHPPLYALMMWVWTRVFGDSEVAVRLLPLIFGLGTIGMVALVGEKLAGQRVGLFAAFLVAGSPVHIWYSQEARPYSVLVFFLLVGIYAFYRFGETQSRLWLLAYGTGMGAAVFIHYYAAVFVLILSGLSWHSRAEGGRPLLKINCLLLIVLGVFLAAKAAVVGLKLSAGSGRRFTPYDLWTLFMNWLPMGNAIWNNAGQQFWRSVVQAALLTGLVAGAYRSARSARGVHTLLFLSVLPGVLLLAGAISGSRTYVERSVLVLLPFYLIVLAGGAVAWKRRWMRYAGGAALIGLTVVSVAGLYTRSEDWTVYKPNEDWRGAARYFNAELSGAPHLLVFASTRADVLTYYEPRIRQAAPQAGSAKGRVKLSSSLFGGVLRDFADEQATVSERRAREALARTGELVYADKAAGDRMCAEAGRLRVPFVYVIRNQYWLGNFEESFGSLAADNRFALVESTGLKGVRIYKYAVAGPCRDPA